MNRAATPVYYLSHREVGMLLRILAGAALLCAVQTSAQLQPGNPPSSIPAADEVQISPYPQMDLGANGIVENDTMSRIRTNDYTPPQTRFFVFPSDEGLGRTCYKIRNYLVVRDDPHSDSFHRDGYTTCVPAARFRIYTTQSPDRTADPPRLSEP
jgi:hypothetical protein